MLPRAFQPTVVYEHNGNCLEDAIYVQQLVDCFDTDCISNETGEDHAFGQSGNGWHHFGVFQGWLRSDYQCCFCRNDKHGRGWELWLDYFLRQGVESDGFSTNHTKQYRWTMVQLL